jgi:hypothetical protein
MAKMVQFNNGVGILLEADRQEVALTITNDGEVGVAALYPGNEGAEESAHAWLAEGIARAIADPDLFDELQELAQRAHDLEAGEPVDVGTDTPSEFKGPTRH